MILIFLGIIMLFFIFLGVKELFKIKDDFCSICLAVSTTWVILLILYWLNLFNNQIIVAILLGQTSVGIFYLWEHKARKELTLFRLPVILSLIIIAYSIINPSREIISSIYLIISLWVIFIFVYFYKNNSSLNSLVNKIVECCKRW